MNELCLRYWQHAQEHYRDADGEPTTELTHFRYAIRVLRETAGEGPAREFGPLAFKRVREAMIGKGWTRPTVNQQCGRVKRIVRWGVENELLPADRWEALRAVRGLSAGRTTAPEPEPVAPVDDEHFLATLGHLNRHVAGLVLFIRLTGCRPQEACRLRRCDIDRTGPVWLYRPLRHKSRVVPIGPRAQALLAAYPTGDDERFVFNPRVAVAEVRLARAAGRKTPRYASHMTRNGAKRKAQPKRAPGERYTTRVVDRAVARAIDAANLMRVEAAVEPEFHVSEWAPNQLRHSHATEVRRRFGLEAAQVVLGHERADVTQIYAEKNLALAAKVAAEIG